MYFAYHFLPAAVYNPRCAQDRFRSLKGDEYEPLKRGFLFSLSLSAIAFFCFTLFISQNSFAANKPAPAMTPDPLIQLERDYQDGITLAYRELTQKNSDFSLPKRHLKALVKAVNEAHKQHDIIRVLGLISGNSDIIAANIQSDDIQHLAHIALTYNATHITKELGNIAKNKGDDYTLSRVYFELARHYANSNQWQDASRYLKDIDISIALSKAEGDETIILIGAGLQQQKKHRESIKYYERIKSESPYYRIAQLNIAIAYIRQEWWTDAQIAIKHALESSPNSKDELSNRLYNVLGFLQLQYGFYRDARESFRNISLKSHYANRALLGLGMAALHQEDFVGALNAFSHLKKKEQEDISVIESYLLSAYTLVHLKQSKTASAAYTEAVAYYEQKSIYYDNLLKSLQSNRADIKRQEIFELSPVVKRLHDNTQHIQQLLAQPVTSSTKKTLTTLSFRLQEAMQTKAQEAVKNQQAVIDSYLSQSRFGLARLYDDAQ